MEIRHLKYFVTVAEELHFGRAAARLKISQPPLSKQIGQLEEEIGARLFFRTKRHVELTDAGKVFLEQTYQILSRIEKACEDARNVHRGEMGTLVIGYTGTLNNILLQILLSYRAKFPEVEVVLHQLGTTDQVKALNEERIHIGILYPPIDCTFINLQTILHMPFFAALPLTHPLAAESTPLDVRKLAGERFIVSPRNVGPSYYDNIISICRQAGFNPKISQEAQGLSAILTLVAAGMGVALVTSLGLQHPSSGVVFKKIDTEITNEISLAWRKDKKLSVVNNFLMLAREIIAGI